MFTFYNLIHILAIFMPLSFYGFITIPKHTRLVQICSPTLESINVEIVTKLSDSERGENGFGSTGTTEIVELSETSYQEIKIQSILPNWSKDVKCIHTLNHAGKMTVIDSLIDRAK